jgi:Na+/H+-dicarboxylate symporter
MRNVCCYLILRCLSFASVSPIGVFFLIAGQLLEMNDFGVIVGQLGMYFVTVLVGIFIHGFIVLPILYVSNPTVPPLIH